MLEIDRDSMAVGGLNLADAPVQLLRVTDEVAWSKRGFQRSALAFWPASMAVSHAMTSRATARYGGAAWDPGECLVAANVELLLTELLVSRLCHDLISPVGAIGNGLELMEEGDAALAKEAMELSQQSARRASGRLQFFRLVFGSGGARQILGLAEAGQLASGYLDGRKIALEWPTAEGAPELPPGGGRMLLGLVMLAAECLARGGVLSARIATTDLGMRIKVVAKGSDAHVPLESMGILGGDGDVGSLTVGNVGAYFVKTFAARHGATLPAPAAQAGAVEFEAILRVD